MYLKGKHHNSIYVSIFHKESLKSRSGLLTTFVLDPRFSFHRDILVSSSSLTLQMGRRAWLLPIWYPAPCTWHLVPRAWHLDSPEKTPDLKTQTLVDSCEPWSSLGLEPAFANCCRRQVWSGIVHSVLYLNLLVHLKKKTMKKKIKDKRNLCKKDKGRRSLDLCLEFDASSILKLPHILALGQEKEN